MKIYNIEKYLTIKNIHSYVRHKLDMTFGKTGDLPTTVMCLGRKDLITVIAIELPDLSTQNDFFDDFRLLCVAEDALAAVAMNEIWMRPPDKQLYRPSEHPDKQEYVLVSIELAGSRSEVHLYPIIREDDVKPRLGQSPIPPEIEEKMVGFLPSNPPTNEEKIIEKVLWEHKQRLQRANNPQWN